MFVGESGYLYCGQPVGEYGDGCYGGCILEGCHQEEEMPEGPCPMHEYRHKVFEESQARYQASLQKV